MSAHLRAAWRQRVMAATLPEDRYGTKARVTGHPSPNCMVTYNRDTDTLIFVPKVPSSYDPERLQPETLRPDGGIDFYTPPGSSYPPIGLGNGAVFDIENGEIAPATGGVAPTTPTMFNPLYIEALERLLDTFPEMGRWRLYDAPAGDYGGGHVRGTARDWLVNVNDMRAEFSASRKLAWSQVCLYHGTMGMYADKIMREGLSPRTSTGVQNHWLGDNNRWQSREGLVYLSHPSRLTVSRSAMSKAADATADELYGAEKKALEDEYRSISGRWYNPPAEGTPEGNEYKAVWGAYHDKSQALREKIANDPRLEPVLLRVCIPREGWKNLRADEDTQQYSDATTLMTNMPEWMGSIGGDAVVAYAGTIPPQWITVAARGREALSAGMVGGPVFR